MSKKFSTFIHKHLPNLDFSKLSKPCFDGITKQIDDNIKNFNADNKLALVRTIKNGDGKKKTVVAQVTSDKVFLIDTFIACINEFDIQISGIVHEDFHYHGAGSSLTLHSLPEEGDKKGVFIYAELSSVLLPRVATKLEKALNVVMEDVSLATSDWQEMLELVKKSKSVLANTDKKFAEYPVSEYEEFLDYMVNDSFTFLGYQKYKVKKSGNNYVSTPVKKDSLGLLSADRKPGFLPKDKDVLNGDVTNALKRMSLLTVCKVREKSTVHRSVPIDAVVLKHIDAKGEVKEIEMYIGLFTSITYSRSIFSIPYLRKKTENVVEQMGFKKQTHNYRGLIHVLEKYPRDEMFQIQEDLLVEYAAKILSLQESQRVAMFPRQDVFQRYISCLVYIPRMVFDADLRKKIQWILEESFDGKAEIFHTNMDDSVLVRVLFVFKLTSAGSHKYDFKSIEQRIIEEGKSWRDKLAEKIRGENNDPAMANRLIERYQRAFPSSYKDAYQDYQALKDIAYIEEAIKTRRIQIDLYNLKKDKKEELRLKLYHAGAPVILSDILPILANMGIDVISEKPHKVSVNVAEAKEGEEDAVEIDPVYIHDLLIVAEKPYTDQKFNFPKPEEFKENFEEALLKIWEEKAEDDPLNALIILSNMTWREVIILRGYVHYLRQIRYVHSRAAIMQALIENPRIAASFVQYFKTRFDPEMDKERETIIVGCLLELDHLSEGVESIEQDRIFRTFREMISHTLRTNYFQKDKVGKAKSYLSYKIQSRDIEELPLPKPWVEIFVYSAQFEAIHLRGGKIARGGLRWSDRQDDFRTEILGLMKAQNVKNAVIVPVGSKGGFVLKNLPKDIDRDGFKEAGITAYKTFISGLLDITDNYKGKKIVSPKDMIAYDEADPYLAVAADKGTATFSDIANGIAIDYDFWLGDAFASGGSAGYDHKKMGITARGAWEAVKRHFRELGLNTQEEEFDVIGVGDMGGDVFGNGMLLSEQIRLVGAFNHLHIFCDPNPDPKSGFKERKRLFDNVKGWDAYNEKLLSKGGRIYNRNDKVLTLTAEIKKRFNIDEDKVAPYTLIKAMLKAETDLMWFGGIGTYVKSKDESHLDASDKANDLVRIDAHELKSRVVGEGANLGMTQKGRIEFCQNGGYCNTDFIDNSAGVNSSDMEVNIKISLKETFPIKNKQAFDKRTKILEEMTEAVAQKVLCNNYWQTQAISLMGATAQEDHSYLLRMISEFERRLNMDRRVEYLPSKEEAEQRFDAGKVLTRPEFSTIFCYSKILFYNDLLASNIPDQASCDHWLIDYFPAGFRDKFQKEIKDHSLRREIVATEITNSVVNRLGPAAIYRCVERSAASAANVVQAYLIVRHVFGLKELWSEIEALDNKIPSVLQKKCFHEIQALAEYDMLWFLMHPRLLKKYEDSIDDFSKGYQALMKIMPDVLPPDLKESYYERYEEYKAEGLDDQLARLVALTQNLVSAPDIILLATQNDLSVQEIAEIYYHTGYRLQFVWVRNHCRELASDNTWEEEAAKGLVDQFFEAQFHIVREVIALKKNKKNKDKNTLDIWIDGKKEIIAQYDRLIEDIQGQSYVSLAMLSTVEQRLRSLLS